MQTNFPDKKYLRALIKHLGGKLAKTHRDPIENLLAYSGMAMNWIADYVTDSSILWTKETLPLDSLYLTGTWPEWNKIIIDKSSRSPAKLRQLINSNPKTKNLFKDANWAEIPILIRFEEGKYKVLDGMTRTIAAIRDGKRTITAFVARQKGKRPKPSIEPHVIYDLLRAYHRGLNKDRKSLIIALRFLRKSYTNVDDLLKNRFSKTWVPSDEIQEIIKEALK